MKPLFAPLAASLTTLAADAPEKTVSAISRDCALSCARKGPAERQNGKRVTITGKIYTRGGSNPLMIEKIADAANK